MDLSAQISSLGTRMDELTVVSDTRFYSMEDRMDQYQTGFTSQFKYLQWDHLLSHHSLSLLTQRYHLIRHLTLLIMLFGCIYLLILAF